VVLPRWIKALVEPIPRTGIATVIRKPAAPALLSHRIGAHRRRSGLRPWTGLGPVWGGVRGPAAGAGVPGRPRLTRPFQIAAPTQAPEGR